MSNKDNLEQNVSEIDIIHIIKDVAKQKMRFLKNGLMALTIWLVLFLIYAIATFNSSNYYSLVISLNFPQAAQSKYPNGSTFSPSDIVSNTVLEKVWTNNKLADKGISLQDFQKSLTAIPYTGEINFIDTKYKNLLAQKNLSRNDVEKIEADYRIEVAQASSRNIKLTLYSNNNSYDHGLASKVLNEIASTWSQTAIEKLGVSRSPVLDGITLNDQMKSQPPLVVVSYLNDLVYKAQTIIMQMQLDANSNSYRDEETSSNLSGLSLKLTEIANYQIDQLDTFLALNYKISDFELQHTRYKLQELQEQRKILLLKAESTQRALSDYTGAKSQTADRDLKNRNSACGDPGLQINGDAITKIFSLVTESKDAEYRQRLTSDRIILEGQANDLSHRISKLERRMHSIQIKSAGFTPEIKKEYTSLLDMIWGNLAGVINAIGRIQAIAQKDFVGDSGLLYTLVGQPEPYSPGPSALKKAGKISIFVTLFLSVLFTLGRLFAGKVFGKSGLSS